MPQISHEGIVELGEQKLLGTAIRTTNRNEQNLLTAKIPGHWREFAETYPVEGIPNTLLDSPIAAYIDYESDHQGEYTHVIGYLVASFPEKHDMGEFIIAPGRYIEFAGKGEIPEVVMAAWGEVWNYFERTGSHERSYIADLEVYTDDGVELLVSLQPRVFTNHI